MMSGHMHGGLHLLSIAFKLSRSKYIAGLVPNRSGNETTCTMQTSTSVVVRTSRCSRQVD